ncbi:transposase [Verminephrobacter aporrectodeae]|uniref:transposase n=1 Tax=Verminephrobacter aporrectodeae TaxID=1110389 RepID=UPI00223829FC|nr:transposase [Verminephrobacter aporrectodeae]
MTPGPVVPAQTAENHQCRAVILLDQKCLDECFDEDTKMRGARVSCHRDDRTAVILIQPARVCLPRMTAEDVFHGELSIINHGLTQADSLKQKLARGVCEGQGAQQRTAGWRRTAGLVELDVQMPAGTVQEAGQQPQERFAVVVRGMLGHRSNACVDAMNGLLQQAKRAARGFRTSDNFITIPFAPVGVTRAG